MSTEAAVGRDRLWFSRQGEFVAPTSENFAAFRERSLAEGMSPLLLHTPEALRDSTSGSVEANHRDEMARINRLPPAERIAAEVVSYRPTELVVRVRSPAAGWLLVTDRWAPGWRAEIDGRPTTIFGGNFIFRAVEVPQGLNEIRFSYRSAAFPWFLLVSWCTLTVVAVWAALNRGASAKPTAV